MFFHLLTIAHLYASNFNNIYFVLELSTTDESEENTYETPRKLIKTLPAANSKESIAKVKQ